MISFKKYITEDSATAKAFTDAKGIAKYIKSERYRELFVEALDALASAAEAREIYNARFGEHKMRMMRGIEYGYRELFDSIKMGMKEAGINTMDLWSISSITDITKLNKLYNSMSPKNEKALEFMRHISGIPNALKVMKGYVKSGKPPVAPKPGQFVKPLASMEATKLAMKFMTEATESFKNELESSVSSRITAAYEKVKTARTPKDISKDDSEMYLASIIFIVRYQEGKKIFELKQDSDSIVKKHIKNSVNDIVDSFIAKNTSKLALILQKKDAPKSHKIVRTNIRNGLVENTMDFVFNDGSSFTLESSVIYKYSNTGKLFFQYPTRFKDVKLADGTKMSMPSEEKMIKEF